MDLKLNHISELNSDELRDLGFVIGALGIGFIADFSSMNIAIQTVGWIALGSGIFVIIVMHETKRN